MRIVWKDSSAKTEYKPIKYRKHIITGYKGGWTVDIPGDNNIYRNNFCAMNAIDKAYGEEGQRGVLAQDIGHAGGLLHQGHVVEFGPVLLLGNHGTRGLHLHEHGGFACVHVGGGHQIIGGHR